VISAGHGPLVGQGQARNQEQKAAVEYLQAQYLDIQQNFDPSVVPLRKKRKIDLADGALDGLS